jgi:hypothetical protein
MENWKDGMEEFNLFPISNVIASYSFHILYFHNP